MGSCVHATAFVPLDERVAAEAHFREIAEAYEVLGDEGKRAAYDRGEDAEEGGGGHEGHGDPFGGGGFNQGNMHFSFRFG
ncbi:DnaJ subfamily B member 8 [Tetrabaena socialis]|uniref:DnaJ subfamily B member 8 n=1 Tax=Tetrabaena socialis TaxID=47790 RepID=A0A2J7ZWW5_9CHLO|nr:DnaJ subfamily B member 8 [Tetrabaena socialis]|eukprot:PNH04735.1 DnaJ subfamily B member 8 [Tetrabaena socialis]